MTRALRIWGKKRGDRRTGSKVLGSVGEAAFFAALLLLGSLALVLLASSHLLGPGLELFARGWGMWSVLLVLLSLILIGAGGVIRNLVHVGTSAERRSALASRASHIDILGDALPSDRDYPTIPRDENLTNSPGTTLAYRLPTSHSPAWKLFTAGLFCLLWNGLVAVIALLVIGSHFASQFNWFFTLFLLPFAIVGFRSVLLFLRLLVVAAGFGPTTLEVASQPFVPGCRYDLFLSQAGRLSVKSFRALLVCEEEAVYRQGTDVRTEQRRVHEQQVFRRENFEIAPAAPFEHRCELTVPEDVMHSFKAAHNAIHWKIVVEGEVARWSRFERVFPVLVYPRSYCQRMQQDGTTH